MTLTWNTAAEIAAILAVILPTIGAWSSGMKRTQALLFKKHDDLNEDLQDYKLEVAKTYINREMLDRALEPIKETLKEIRSDLHQDRRDHP